MGSYSSYRPVPGRLPARDIMIETNPILAQIADLSGRIESLRGYL